MRQFKIVVLAIVLMSSTAGAQQLAMARTGFVQSRMAELLPPGVALRAEDDTAVAQMVVTALVAAFVGVAGGAYLGFQTADCTNSDWFCGFAEGAIGAIVGSTVMIPLGVHLVSRHSPFYAKFGVSVIALGTAAAVAHMSNGLAFLLMPPVQIVATIRIEEIAARRKGVPWAQP